MITANWPDAYGLLGGHERLPCVYGRQYSLGSSCRQTKWEWERQTEWEWERLRKQMEMMMNLITEVAGLLESAGRAVGGFYQPHRYPREGMQFTVYKDCHSGGPSAPPYHFSHEEAGQATEGALRTTGTAINLNFTGTHETLSELDKSIGAAVIGIQDCEAVVVDYGEQILAVLITKRQSPTCLQIGLSAFDRVQGIRAWADAGFAYFESYQTAAYEAENGTLKSFLRGAGKYWSLPMADRIPKQVSYFSISQIKEALKGTTVIIRRYAKGWMIICDSLVSWISDQGIWNIRSDCKMKGTLAAYGCHLLACSGKVKLSKIIQKFVRLHICNNRNTTLEDIWRVIEPQVLETFQQLKLQNKVAKKWTLAKLVVIDRTREDKFMLVQVKKEKGEHKFQIMHKMKSECILGSGKKYIKVKPWPKSPRIDRAKRYMNRMIDDAARGDRSTGGYAACYTGGVKKLWGCQSCRKLP